MGKQERVLAVVGGIFKTIFKHQQLFILNETLNISIDLLEASVEEGTTSVCFKFTLQPVTSSNIQRRDQMQTPLKYNVTLFPWSNKLTWNFL